MLHLNHKIVIIDAFNVHYHLHKIMKERKITVRKSQRFRHSLIIIDRVELTIKPFQITSKKLKETIWTLH